MYTLVYDLRKVSEHETFEDSFIALFDRLMSENDNVTLRFIERAIWIEESNVRISFDEARKMASKKGILINGEINPNYRKICVRGDGCR